MTMRGLLTFFEQFYGEKYSGVFLDTMCGYLDGYSESFYDAAARVIIKRFPRTLRQAPSQAQFEDNMDEILAELPRVESLPEPRPEISDEERKEMDDMIAGWKQSLKDKKPGPMGKALTLVMEDWR